MTRPTVIGCQLLLLLMSPLGAFAQLPAAVPAEHLVRAELISEVETIEAGTPVWLGVRLMMADGWHVNWLNPGDAGLAPDIEWRLPPGFAVGDTQWPFPRRFDLPDLSIYGYEEEVILIVQLTPPATVRPGETFPIAARVNWLACNEACIPGTSEIQIDLPSAPGPARPSRWREAIERSRDEVPAPAHDWTLGAVATGNYIALRAVPPEEYSGRPEAVRFYPTEPGIIDNASPQTFVQSDAGYELKVHTDAMNTKLPARIRGVLVSQNGWGEGDRRALAVDVPLQ